MIDRCNSEQILLNISDELNIQLNIIDRPNCSELILESILSVDDVPFGLSKGITYIKIFGSSILIISALGNPIEETLEINDKCILTILEQCNIINKIYNKDKCKCYYNCEANNKYQLRVDTNDYLDKVSEEDFKRIIQNNLETLKKLSVSVKGVIYLYTRYEDN